MQHYKHTTSILRYSVNHQNGLGACSWVLHTNIREYEYLQRIEDYLTMVGRGYPGCSVEISAVYYVHNTAVRSELPCLRHARTASRCFPQVPQGTCTAINNSFINNISII